MSGFKSALSHFIYKCLLDKEIHLLLDFVDSDKRRKSIIYNHGGSDNVDRLKAIHEKYSKENGTENYDSSTYLTYIDTIYPFSKAEKNIDPDKNLKGIRDALGAEILSYIFQDISDAIQNAHSSTEKIDLISESITYLRTSNDDSGVINLEDSIHKYLKTSTPLEGKRVINTGYPTLDGSLKGLFGGDLIAIVAPTGTGKTWLGLNILKNIFDNNGKILAMSLEMDASELYARYLSLYTGNDPKSYMSMTFKESEKLQLIDYLRDTVGKHRLKDCLFLEKSYGLNLSIIAKHIEETKPDVLFIDSVYNMVNKADARHTDYIHIFRGCKSLGLRYNIPIIVSSQLSGDEAKSSRKGVKVSPEAAAFSKSLAHESSVMLALQDITDNENTFSTSNYKEKRITLIKSRHSQGDLSFNIKYVIANDLGITCLDEVDDSDNYIYTEESDGLENIL